MKIQTLRMIFACSALLGCAPSAFAEEVSAATEAVSPALSSNEPGTAVFLPPKGWRFADTKDLPPSVKVMVVGKGQHEFPPTINLATENYGGTLKDYLKLVKEINDSQGTEWKDLGNIKTEAGNASLSQVDKKTEWGDVKMMHVILVRNKTAYIMTTAALRDEFSKFYKDFFGSMLSLRINKDLYEMVPTAKRRAILENSIAKLKQSWQNVYIKEKQLSPGTSDSALTAQVFSEDDFQKNFWGPFKDMLKKDFSDMGASWEEQVLSKIQNELEH